MAKWWTESWNPVTGCTPISEACHNCYAERWAQRFAGRAGYPAGDDCFKVTLHRDRLEAPFRWRKRRRVFVGNMGDLFHQDVPDDFLDEVFFPIRTLDVHVWMILTKRAERLPEYLNSRAPLGAHVWLGVTVETQERDYRVRELMKVKGEAKHFISVEPMLSALKLWEWLAIDRVKDTTDYERSGRKPMLDWVQCGGESGRDARPMEPIWAYDLVDQCQAAGVPFYFKQNFGGHPVPVGLNIREIPAAAEV